MAEIPEYLTFSIIVTIAVFLISVLVIAYFAAKKLGKSFVFTLKVAMVLLSWFVLVFLFGKAGVFAADFWIIPGIIIGFLLLFIFLKRVYFSAIIRAMARAASMPGLIAIQTYRIVGVGFLNLYRLGVLPAAFAFPSGYGDILVGVTAPLVAYFYAKKYFYGRTLAIIWNIVGIADLVIAISVGILGYPRPLQVLPTTPSTEPLSLFPLALIPLFAVPLALLLHLLSLLVLRDQGREN